MCKRNIRASLCLAIKEITICITVPDCTIMLVLSLTLLWRTLCLPYINLFFFFSVSFKLGTLAVILLCYQSLVYTYNFLISHTSLKPGRMKVMLFLIMYRRLAVTTST